MGLLTTSGSLARVIGPVFVSFIYQEYGTWLLFGIVAASLGLSFVITTFAYRQLVPFDQMDKNRSFFEQIKFWKGWTGIWQTEKPKNLPSNEVSGVFNENYQNEIAVPKDSNGQNILQQPE